MLLNGTSSRAETTGLGGITASGPPARTIAAIVNRTSSSGFRNVVSLNTSGNGTQLDMGFNGTTMICEGATSTANGPTVSTGRMYIAVDKASGAATPRFHKQIYGTDAAVAHSNGTGAVTENTAIAKVSIGSFSNNTDWFAGDIYVVGIWNRQLADWEHEWLAASVAAWAMLEPDFLIVELGAALPTNIPDLSGKGAPLTTLTNLAVSTVSMPVPLGGAILPVTRPGAAAGGDATVTAALLDGTGDLVAPAVSAGSNVSAALLDGVGDLVGNFPVSVSVDVPPMDGTGDLVAPGVSGSGNAEVAATPCDGTGDLVAPALVASSTRPAAVMDGTGGMGAPVFSGHFTATSPALDGTGDLVAPTVAGHFTATSPALDGTGDVVAPAVAAGSNIVSPKLDGVGDLVAPFVDSGNSAQVSAAPMDGAGDLVAPAATASASLLGAILDGIGDLPAPAVTAGAQIVSPKLDGVGDVPVPQISAHLTVASVALDAIGDLPAPTVTATALVAGALLDGTGDLVTPAVVIGSNPAYAYPWDRPVTSVELWDRPVTSAYLWERE